MRNLFDNKKENKSLKLVKKLQQQADLEWETEVKRRREQELNDEAIAKELQQQLEDEQRRESSSSPPIQSTAAVVTNSSAPPPLPIKPRAYNSSSSLGTTNNSIPSNNHSHSSQSLPTASSSVSITPLYSLNESLPALPPRQNNTGNKPVKSYLPSQSYKADLHFSLSSPSPSPNSVFYQQTPALTPAATISVVSPHGNSSNTSCSHPFYNESIPQRPASTPMTMPEPMDTTPSYTPVQSQSRQSTPVNRPPTQHHSSSHHSDPNSSSYNNTPPPYSYQNNTPPANLDQQRQSSPPISLPLSATEILQNAFHHPQQNQYPVPRNNTSSPAVFTSTPVNNPVLPALVSTSSNHSLPKKSSTNPYYNRHEQQTKPVYYDPVLSLKPDENKHDATDDDWDDEVTVIKTPPVVVPVTSDAESDYDYSDMIYERREKEEPLIEESDPFADSFAVEVPSTFTVLEPTLANSSMLELTVLTRKPTKIEEPSGLVRQLSKIAVEPTVLKEEKVAEDPEMVRKYEEKESNEIEPKPLQYVESLTFQTPIQTPMRHARTQSLEVMDTPPFVRQASSPAFFVTPPVEDEQAHVFPTNILKAGPPTSETNLYSQKQGGVPASDYGYYKETDPIKSKTLPKLPETTSVEDRHITVASINPGQRVWIRIHPTDTGKMLAERIHIVASYQTRKVTKITTKNGRDISLDNKPLFDDWNEIISFKEGEAWTVEWVPIEHPYVDMITEGKEFMKQLKANFKGSSSS